MVATDWPPKIMPLEAIAIFMTGAGCILNSSLSGFNKYSTGYIMKVNALHSIFAKEAIGDMHTTTSTETVSTAVHSPGDTSLTLYHQYDLRSAFSE